MNEPEDGPAADQPLQRREWMGLLALAPREELENAFEAHAALLSHEWLSHEWLRPPETGLVMVRARAGGTGSSFNLGEMTVTRCALRLPDGIIGQGYVQGRDARRAELAALIDALLQREAASGRAQPALVRRLARAQLERRIERSCRAAATKVEFVAVAQGGSA